MVSNLRLVGTTSVDTHAAVWTVMNGTGYCRMVTLNDLCVASRREASNGNLCR